MSHDDHDTTLATIEARPLEVDTPLEDIDARVAEVLGVPVDYYFAYRLVAGAIDSRRHEPADVAPCSREQAVAALTEAQVLADRLATVATAVYRAATGSGTAREVAGHAARLTSLCPALAEQVCRGAALAVPFDEPPLPFADCSDDGEEVAAAMGGLR